MAKQTQKPPRYRLGADVDLDAEDLRDRKGKRIDATYVRQAVEDVHAHVGRPSLTSPGERSPQVSFRVPVKIRAAAVRRAEREGKTVSEVARDALERDLSA